MADEKEDMLEQEQHEEQTIPNKVTVEEAGPCKKKVTIEIPEEKIKQATDKQYADLAKEAEVPGFRKGRAPRRLIEKRFGKEAAEQIKLQLLVDATDSAVKDNELNILREPDVDHEKIELPESGALTFDFEVEVKPEFELPELEGIEVEKTKLEVTDDQVDREIEQLQRWSGVWTPREEDDAIEMNDQIIADVLLKSEDVEEAEKIDNTEIYIRESGFVASIPVDDMEELFVGAKSGDKLETAVDVPKTFFKEEYRGKKVDLKIEVKDIKYLKPAELDENMLNSLGVESVDELRERVEDSLQNRLEQQSRSEMTQQIYKYMLDNTDLELPVDIVADQASMILQRQFTSMLQRGLRREQIEEQMEQLKSGSEEQAVEQLKTFFIMDKVAEKLDVTVTDEEVNGQIAQIAIQQGQRPERLREDMERRGSLSQFTLQVREDKCISKLLEMAKIKEVEAKEEKPKKKQKKSGKKTAKKTTKKKTAAKKSKKSKTSSKKKTEN